MSVYDNTSLYEMNELLQQMKELHPPDRCEGIGNGVWHGFQKFYNMGNETPHQKIEKKWKFCIDHKGLMKMTTSVSAARDALWEIWKVVDSSRTPTVSKTQLDAFIDGCTPSQLQQMFEIMIVQMTWRDRLLTSWDI